MDTLTVGQQTWYSLTKAVIVFNTSRATIHRWINEGKLEKKKLGSATFVRMVK